MFHFVLFALAILALGLNERAEAHCSWKDAIEINGNCYKFVSESRTWQSAQTYCEALPGGGNLAKIFSSSDLSQILPSKYGYTSDFWIGANDITTEGTWKWSDGTPADLSGMWLSPNPDNWNNEDCAQIRGSGINDQSCTTTIPFICMEKPACSWKDSIAINGNCFKFVLEIKTWQSAQTYCEALPGGGNLAKITSSSVLSYILPSKYGYTSDFWIGANDITTEGTWKWAEGTAADLSGMWIFPNPDNWNNEDCAQIRGTGINDQSCSTTLPFICMEKPSCSWQDSVYVNGECYKYVLESKTWEQAQAYCESLPDGGSLAKITSKDALSQLLPSVFDYKFDVWIGANDITTEGTWKWTDGTPADLSGMWFFPNPDNWNNEDCAQIRGSGINDQSCTTTIPFICVEKPKIPSCTAVVDLIYVLDSSGSIGKDNYQKQINFTIDLASNFQIGPSNLLIGAVVFSEVASKYFDLKDYPSFASLRTALSTTPFMGYTTRTDQALDLITNAGMFTAAAGGRSNSYKTVVVITDGQSDYPTLTQQAAARLKSQGVTINAVGIGAAVSSELLAIASSSSNVFKVTSFDALKQIVTSVTQQACKGSLG